ncbi:hypothetical protein [Aliikangiella sp. G2MR2-5]|uniref:hypothetical protein n=1 Tax=Aliikangiella sp. G2MR2-5 TaxID=2788943 RepID=UPI0018ABC921|nr:hypothetical protein [Aliikangiella sp. G2MR2-5]
MKSKLNFERSIYKSVFLLSFPLYLMVSPVAIGGNSSTGIAPGNFEKASLELLGPVTNAEKTVFRVEGYQSQACALKEKLTRKHPSYLGNFIHSEEVSTHKTIRPIQIKAGSPITLSGLFSEFSDRDNTSICYYQSQSFTPSSGKHYQLLFKRDCSVEAIETSSGMPEKVKLKNVADICFGE